MFRYHADTGRFSLNLDNSTMEKLVCPRSFEFYSVFGRDTASRDPLTYGSAIHLALEHYFATGDSEQMIPIMAKYFADNPTSDGSWRNLDHAVESMRRYVAIRQQLPAWTPITMPDGKKAVEVGFRLPLRSDRVCLSSYPAELICADCPPDLGYVSGMVDIFYTGKLDLIIHADEPGEFDIVDHKTTSIGGPTFWQAFRLSPQMRGYAWATWQILGRPPRRVIVDAIIGRAPTAKGKGIAHDCEYQSYEYSADQITEWHRNVNSHIDTMLSYLGDGYFPENNHYCSNKYGMCSYFDVCSQRRNARHIILGSGQFADRTWSPV